LAHKSVCFEKELVVKDSSVQDVVKVCENALKGMGLKIMSEEDAKDGHVTVMAGERALIPLMMKMLMYPFSLGEYVKSAQRSGIHVVVSPEKDGIHLNSCGIALDEITGKLATYTKDEIVEEITNMMEATDFENKFIKKVKTAFPNITEAT
jgi:hypothetical protein